MYEDDDKTEGSSRRHRSAKSLGEEAEALLGKRDTAGAGIGAVAQEQRSAKVVSGFSRRIVKSRGSVGVRGQRLSAKRSHHESTVVCRLKPLTAFAILLFTVMSGSAFAGVESPQFDPFDGPAILPIFLMLVGFSIGLFVFGIGFAFAVFAAGLAALLVAVGIVSSAVMIGVLRRRVSSGVRAFHYILSVAIAVPATVGALWLARFVFPIKLSTAHIWMLGTFSGIFGGLVFAHTLNVVARTAYRRFFSPTSTL